MALRFIDGFDTYATADIGVKWNYNNNGTITSSGRIGGSALHFSGGGSIMKNLGGQPTWIIGCAMKFNGGIASGQIIVLNDGSNGTQVDVRLNSDGTFQITRNGTTLATSTFAAQTAIWYYVEFMVTIASSIAANSCQLRVSGNTIINLAAGTNTQATANASASLIYLQSNGFNSADYDDLYICDGTGTRNNTFLGDMRVEAWLPNAAGNYAQFALNGTPTTTYGCINENPEDGDTSYISSATAGQKSSVKFPSLSSTPQSIAGIQIDLVSRKDDAGSRTAASFVRISATDYQQGNLAVLDNYTHLLSILETNPATATGWSPTDVNALEAGVTLVS